MAKQAQSANVIQIALATALGDREDVIGVPERSPRSDGAHAVYAKAFSTGCAASTLQRGIDGEGVGITDSTSAMVTGENLIAQIPGI